MTRREKIGEALDCLGFLLFMALILLATAYYSTLPGMHSEKTMMVVNHAL